MLLCALDTQESRGYIATHTSHIRSRYICKVRCTYITLTWHVNRDVRVAYQEYYGVPVTLLSYVRRVTYVRRIGPATYVLPIFKCTPKKRSTSVYEEYVLRIEEYELCMLHTYDVRVTYLSYLDTP